MPATSRLRKTSYTLFLTALLILGAIILWQFFSAAPGGAPLASGTGAAGNSVAVTIADMASTYYGALSRPLFPESSLGLPLAWQAILSLGLTIFTLLAAALLPKARVLMMWLTVLLVTRHLVWRLLYTIDLSTPWTAALGLVIYAAEMLAYFSMVLGYYQMSGQTNHQPVSLSRFAPDQLPAVDVMVCTYNEPVSVVYRTMVGCMAIDYPKKQVYLLDDGHRSEMEELAQKLGCHYLTRPDNRHAKAGNLNNALKNSEGDLVVVFDADHVPCKSFLKETVGFFVDDKLAFVQTPQHFFTPDPFQRNLAAEKTINNEQDLFFHVIQPGNDSRGAAFFAGSGAIFRRQALYEIGGFAVETVTEDTHTGLRLHANGWKSLFYNRDLAAGLAQDSFGDYVKQRLRWARGMAQILWNDNPLFVKGLRLPQRLCYLSGIWYFFSGFQRLVFLIAPLFFLLFGVKTINAGFIEVMVYYLPSFVALFVGYGIITRGVRQSFWSEVYEVSMCVYMFLVNIHTMLFPRRGKFAVTPKGTLSDKTTFRWQIVAPQILIAGLTLLGMGMAVMRAIYSPDYWGGIATNVFWALYNLVLLVGGIYVAWERPQFRLAPRIFKKIRAEVRLLDGSMAVGYTLNISESGVSSVFEEPIPVTGTLTLKLLDWDINESSTFQVQAIRSTVDAHNRHYVGFRVVNRTEEQHQKLVRHMFGNADIWAADHMYTGTTRAFWELASVPLRLAGKVEQPINRRTARFQATLSCALEVAGRHIIGVSNEVSETGLSVIIKADKTMPLPCQVGDGVVLRLQWPNGSFSELSATIVRMEKLPEQQLKLGLNFANLTRQQRLEIIGQIYRPREQMIRVAPSVQKVLRGTLVVPDTGQRIPVYTQEISEMGAVLALQERVALASETPVELEIDWSDGAGVTQGDNDGGNAHLAVYPAMLKGIRQAEANQYPVALIYFERLNLRTLDDLSAHIHEPMESRTFQTLNEA